MPAGSLDELVAQFDEAIDKVDGLILKHTEQGALGALALVDSRITEKGVDANGGKFKDYSSRKLPLFFFQGDRELPLPETTYDGPKVKGKRRKRKGIAEKYPDGISYKEYKTEVGRYRGHVDFSLSGQMLASTTTGFERIGITARAVKSGKAKIAFEGRDETTRNKLKWNNNKRPGFLNPSQEEMKIVTRVANKGMSEDLAAIFQ